MSTFLTSDLHINHKAMITNGWRRDFSCIEEMDKTIACRWNSVVRDSDTTIIAGDVCMGSQRWNEFRKQLNGKIVIVRGNHDPKGLSSITYSEIKYGGSVFEITHDPEDAYHHGNVIIHGHIHNGTNRHADFKDSMVDTIIHRAFFNVNTEFHNYTPVKLDTIIKTLRKESLRKAAQDAGYYITNDINRNPIPEH